MDLVAILLTLGFFLLSGAFVRLCGRV